MNDLHVRFIPDVDPRTVFNLTSPRWLPNLAKAWFGSLDWHDKKYDPLRDLVERRYIELFERATGHYSALQKSLTEEGFRNPVMLTAGRLIKRNDFELPPDVRATRSTRVFCEYVGGSRVMMAVGLGMKMPAIVNDFTGVFEGRGEIIPIRQTEHALRHFKDRPARVQWLSRFRGAFYANNLPFAHYEIEKRISMLEQMSIRRDIIQKILNEDVRNWMAMNDYDPREPR